MIKNIYDKADKKYWHKYYCDNCFGIINFGQVLRSEKALEYFIFDLCSDCFREFEGSSEEKRAGDNLNNLRWKLQGRLYWLPKNCQIERIKTFIEMVDKNLRDNDYYGYCVHCGREEEDNE